MKRQSAGSPALWVSIGGTALAATLLLLFGFAYAVHDIVNPNVPAMEADGEKHPDKPPLLADKDEILITAFGDSITKGTGDNTGQGYVRQVMDGLSVKLDKPVKLVNNLAINGLRADQLAERLESDSGFQYAIRQANVILFTIGGNDLFQFAQGTTDEQTSREIRLERVESRLNEAFERLAKVFKLLNELNPDAKIVYIGLYNPFYDIEKLQSGSLQVQEWNSQAHKLALEYSNLITVPTYDLFENTIGTYLSSDHFHPNHEGYGQIASRIVQILE